MCIGLFGKALPLKNIRGAQALLAPLTMPTDILCVLPELWETLLGQLSVTPARQQLSSYKRVHHSSRYPKHLTSLPGRKGMILCFLCLCPDSSGNKSSSYGVRKWQKDQMWEDAEAKKREKERGGREQERKQKIRSISSREDKEKAKRQESVNIKLRELVRWW